jgi:anaerobic magnesium-protoporphyrin IX monomethyl ester cyclase
MLSAPDSSIDVLLIEDQSQQHLQARTLAAVLQRAGLRAQLAHFQDIGAVVALAQRTQPRLIVFSILFADRVPECLSLITALRGSGVRAHMTMAGPLPTFASAELLAACPALDSVLRGEAEASVAQLASTVCHSEPRTPWRGQVGEESLSRGQDVISPLLSRQRRGLKPLNLDDLPFPLRDGGVPDYVGYGFATVEASRGCYHACTFCLPCAFYRAMGAPYRLRSISNLMDEIGALYRRGTRLFLFDDEQFLPPGRAREKRVDEWDRELERRKLRVAFTIKCRADDVEGALFRRLKGMGLMRVYIGVESGCQETLDRLGKGVTAQRNAEALAILDELEIVADFRSLLFHPWSTLETVQAELAFLQGVMPHAPTTLSFHEVEVYPGTSLADRLKAEGRGAGAPWPLPYVIGDPRVELLRRLSRLVFSPTRDLLTPAWYALLLRRRFESQPGAGEASGLKAMAARVNSESLGVWQDMLQCARGGEIYDADQINERAAAWAGRINSVCAQVQGELEGKQR